MTNCIVANGMSLIDFVLTYKGDMEFYFDTITEMKYTSNETYFIENQTSYRVEITNKYLDKPIVSMLDTTNIIGN